MQSIEERITQLKSEFARFNDWEDRYKELIRLGKNLSGYPEEQRLDKFKVRGCQSQVWLYPELKEKSLHFYGDSDAVLVKGIIALLIKVYSEASPDEIIKTKADFLKEMGVVDNLSMSRANGLASMVKQIQLYALAFKTQL